MQAAFDRRRAVTGELRQILEAQHADVLRAHGEIVGGRRCDRNVLRIDAQREITARCRKKAAVAQVL